MSQPVVFAALADVELDPAPIPQHWIIDGTPQAYSRRLSTSADGTAAVIAWSCTPGRFTWHYPVDEILHILSGEVFVTDERGKSRRLGPGDVAVFPAGCSSTWHVTQEVRKLAVCRHSMPRLAGYALRIWNNLGSIIFGSENGDALDSGPARRGAGGRAEPA